MERDVYSQGFRRVRLEAASRLVRPEFEQMRGAARAVGISEAMLKLIEQGKRRPSFETLEAMARAYNVELGDLLPSSAPRGPEVDRILGPLATLPPGDRDMYITQMSALARMLATSINRAFDAGAERNQETYSRSTDVGPYDARPLQSDEPGAPPPQMARQTRPSGGAHGRHEEGTSRGRRHSKPAR